MSIDPRRVASFLFQYNYYARGLNAGDSRAVAAADRAYGDKMTGDVVSPRAEPPRRRAPTADAAPTPPKAALTDAPRRAAEETAHARVPASGDEVGSQPANASSEEVSSNV